MVLLSMAYHRNKSCLFLHSEKERRPLRFRNLAKFCFSSQLTEGFCLQCLYSHSLLIVVAYSAGLDLCFVVYVFQRVFSEGTASESVSAAAADGTAVVVTVAAFFSLAVYSFCWSQRRERVSRRWDVDGLSAWCECVVHCPRFDASIYR